MTGDRRVGAWKLAGLLVLLVVAACSMPLGSRPADDVSDVLPALRPITLVSAPGGGAHAEAAALGALPSHRAPTTRPVGVVPPPWVLVAIVSVALVSVLVRTPRAITAPGLLRSRAPPVSS